MNKVIMWADTRKITPAWSQAHTAITALDFTMASHMEIMRMFIKLTYGDNMEDTLWMSLDNILNLFTVGRN